jgi:hypothetical protein
MDINLTPIAIPPEPNWTEALDANYVADLLDDGWSFDELWIRAFDSLCDLSQSLRKALVYFGENVDRRDNITIAELIYLVEKQIRSRAPSQAYVDRFIEHLDVCRFAAREFDRIIGVYAANPQLRWLAPLADLGDWLITAVMMFEEGLVCEHEDLKNEWRTYC